MTSTAFSLSQLSMRHSLCNDCLCSYPLTLKGERIYCRLKSACLVKMASTARCRAFVPCYQLLQESFQPWG